MSATDTIQQHVKLWQEFKAEILRHANAISEMKSTEAAALGFDLREDYLHSSIYDYRPDPKDTLTKAAARVVGILVRLAEKNFSGTAGRLEIDDSKYMAKHVQEDDYSRERRLENTKAFHFDPLAVWADLEADYGGNQGEEEAYRQAAAGIIRELSIYEGDTATIRSGYYVLDQRMYLDSFDKKWGKTRYSYHCCDNVANLGRDLAVFARWASEDHAVTMLLHNTRAVASNHREVVSREKFIICDSLMFITLHNRIEWRFGLELGQQLQCFLSMYGTLKQKRA